MPRIRFIFVAALAALVAACGHDTGGGGAPDGGSVTINPSAISSDVKAGGAQLTQAQQYTIHVASSTGSPIKDAKVQLFLDLATNTISPGGVVMVLLDQNGNPQVSPFEVKTDSFGNITVFIDYLSGGGLSYTGNLQAFTGDASSISTVTVTCTSTTTTMCP